MNKRPWQRLLLSLIGLALIGGCWFAAVQHLYTLKPEALAAFTTITVNAFYVVAAIIIFMVTGRLVYEWKNNSVSQIIEAGEQRLADIKRTPAPKHFDDEEVP